MAREFGTSSSWKHIMATLSQPSSRRANFAGNSAFKSFVVVKITCEILSCAILFLVIISFNSSRAASLKASTELFSTVMAPLIPFVIIF